MDYSKTACIIRASYRREAWEIKVSFGLKVWVALGVLCASMAARAEYKEVWNPPEAAHGHGAKHVKTASGARKSVKPGAVRAKPVSVASKPKSVHAKAAAQAPAPVVQARATTPTPAVQPQRELPPILH